MSDGTRNLMVSRSAKSVWDRPGFSLSAYDRERWISGAIGSGLLFAGLRRRGVAGGLMAAAGALISIRSATGHHDFGVAREWMNRLTRWGGLHAKDVVTDASEESFPASDSPSWTPTAGARTNT